MFLLFVYLLQNHFYNVIPNERITLYVRWDFSGGEEGITDLENNRSQGIKKYRSVCGGKTAELKG